MAATFAFPCEYGFTAVRSSYGQRIRIASSSGSAVPSADELGVTSYEITTVPIGNDIALSLDASLKSLRGTFFLSQFYFDETIYKYRIVDDSWTWQVIGPTANIFTLQVERVYEPSVEFAIDYGLSQQQQISAHIFRLATSQGTATPSIISRSLKNASVRTRPMSKESAVALEQTLLALNGGAFYSQLYLDEAPRLYRLRPYEWTWTPDDDNAYVCEFSLIETIANSADIPCVDTLNLERTSRVRVAQFGDGYQQNVPDGINTEDFRYSIETLPLSDTQAASIESTLSALKGDIFYARFKNDTQVYKYRLDGNRWSWVSNGRDANVFRFDVKRAYDL